MSLMVNELMENKRWKEGVLNSIFTMKDAQTWHERKDGEFKVRSAQYMAFRDELMVVASTSHSHDNFDWKQLWSASIYPKSKHLMW